MLTPDHLSILRAALRYWLDEIVPHGWDAARHYLEGAELSLSNVQIDQLAAQLQPDRLRFARFNVLREELVSLELLTLDDVKLVSELTRESLATVLLPVAAAGQG